MHVIFISACQKRAIRRSRAILDSYALRAGERCWMSPMTTEGLQEVRAALARSATRQTSVACYQNDGRRRMKLLWIMGARGRFGPEGHFPAGYRRITTPVRVSEWVRHAGLAARLAGLLHDLGKYSLKFQEKLRGKAELADAVRHEWISLKLWQAVRSGMDWKTAWANVYTKRLEMFIGEREICNASRYGLASAQECVDALVSTHHGLFSSRLPCPEGRLVRENLPCPPDDALFTPWSEPEGSFWELAQRLDKRLSAAAVGMAGEAWIPYWRSVFLYARAALVFADHTVSALECPPNKDTSPAFANTHVAPDGRRLNQRLAEHLSRVSEKAADLVWRMANLVERPEASLTGLQPCSLEAVLRPADPESRFAWQNTAADALAEAREAYPTSGALVFNMAGTGSGKTRMNVRAACVLSRSDAPRFSIALNLRSLTLQTGRALQCQLGLSDSDLATVIGDDVTRKLFNASNIKEKENIAAPWSDDDGNPAETEALTSGGNWPLPAWLESFFPKPQERRIVGAPLLVSTIDYLIAAGEPHRQGHHVKALLRLMSADLVLDEIDSYDPESLVAVLRLVQWCAFFGRNVICSSATLSRPVAQAVEAAYASGAEMARALRHGKSACTDEEKPRSEAKTLYVLAFIDDALPPLIKAVPHVPEKGRAERAAALLALYDSRVSAQLEAIAALPVYRHAELLPMAEESVGTWMGAVTAGVQKLHARHALTDARSGVAYSFGLVRVANIATAVDVARHLAKELPQARVACYHANDWHIARFHKEKRLDFLLSRAEGDRHIVADHEIRAFLDEAVHEERPDVPFIVVATPVEEVGRDHDFDWAVLDVSSAQSLVQAAGRVNRHRLRPCGDAPNIAVPQFNWRHCRNSDRGEPRAPAFCWPGYEGKDKERYSIHDLAQILPWREGRLVITADVRLGEDCRLARRDDKAIAKRLFPYFGPETGEYSFVAEHSPAALLSEWVYNETPLRNRTGRTEMWRLGHDVERLGDVYEAFVYQGERRGTGGQWVERDERSFREVDALPNAWLWLDAETMRAQCEAVGVDEERALSAELVSYSDTDRWEYDKGFGIVRRPAAE